MMAPSKCSDTVLIKDDERYKTTMCQNWTKRGACPYGAKCQFAHGEHELRKRLGKPSKPPNFWMRSKGAKCEKVASTASPPALGPPTIAVPRDRPTALAAPAPEPVLERPAAARAVHFAVPPPVAAAAPSALSPHPAPGISAPNLLAFGPIDALAPCEPTAADAACSLRFNQTTGKVEACESCDNTGSTDPPLVAKRPSYSTQLVRRAVSFLFDGEPSLVRRSSNQASFMKDRSSAPADESAVPMPPPPDSAVVKFAPRPTPFASKLPSFNHLPSFGAWRPAVST